MKNVKCLFLAASIFSMSSFAVAGALSTSKPIAGKLPLSSSKPIAPKLPLSTAKSVFSSKYGKPVSPSTTFAVCANGNPPVDGHCGSGGCVNDCGQLGTASGGICTFLDKSSESIN
jgi:hypothetical protein